MTHIRDAAENDLPAILAIYNHAVIHSTATADYEPHTLEQRAAWLAARRDRGLPVLVAEDAAGVVVGWASLNPYHDRYGYRFSVENSVYVDPQRQGQGVGKALLAELIRRADGMELHAIIASIDGDNTASIRLHEAFGFAACGRLPQIIQKFGRWLDVVYMVKLLP